MHTVFTNKLPERLFNSPIYAPYSFLCIAYISVGLEEFNFNFSWGGGGGGGEGGSLLLRLCGLLSTSVP